MAVTLEYGLGGPASDNCIHIGLLNNMPDEALKATERQFLSLLSAASHGMQVRLSLYSLPEIPRSETSRRHIAAHYSDVSELWDVQLDGFIVTGKEPLAADLKDEPYWDSFVRTLSWARENAYATVWSCLAAHAAVLHMDGIQRAKRSDKLFGIFPCSRVAEHPLLAQAPTHLALPHSRWNSLPANQLAEAGYTVLTRMSDVEVDTFIKQDKNLFVFFQGHPEYEADTLLREFRRDIGRYFKRETPRYPLMPEGYFNHETVTMLNELQQEQRCLRQNELPPGISAALSNTCVKNTWQASAALILRQLVELHSHTQEPHSQVKEQTTVGGIPHSANAGRDVRRDGRSLSRTQYPGQKLSRICEPGDFAKSELICTV